MRYLSSDDFQCCEWFSFGVCGVLDIPIDIVIASLHASFHLMIVYLVIALYIFAPYSHILAFGRISFVFHTTLNKVHLMLSYVMLKERDILEDSVRWISLKNTKIMSLRDRDCQVDKLQLQSACMSLRLLYDRNHNSLWFQWKLNHYHISHHISHGLCYIPLKRNDFVNNVFNWFVALDPMGPFISHFLITNCSRAVLHSLCENVYHI